MWERNNPKQQKILGPKETKNQKTLREQQDVLVFLPSVHMMSELTDLHRSSRFEVVPLYDADDEHATASLTEPRKNLDQVRLQIPANSIFTISGAGFT